MNPEFNIDDPWRNDNLEGLKIYNVSKHQGACNVAMLLTQKGADTAISREEANVVISTEQFAVLGYDRGGSIVFSAKISPAGDLFFGEDKKIVATLARLNSNRVYHLPE